MGLSGGLKVQKNIKLLSEKVRGEKPPIQRRENRDLNMKLQGLKDALEEKNSPFGDILE